MTLVVARVTPLGVRVASDMRVIDPNAANPPGFLGATLKAILLRPTLCIAYAGNVGAAIGAIREVASADLSTEDAVRRLLDTHQQSEPKAEFLVATLRPPALVAVKDDLAQSSSSAWLGDRDAFEEYQEHYHGVEQYLPPRDFYESAEQADDLQIASRMGNGMNAVVHGPNFVIEGGQRTLTRQSGGSHKAVGEEIIYVVPRAGDGLFRYSDQVRARVSPFEKSLPPGLGVVPPDFSAAGGGFRTRSSRPINLAWELSACISTRHNSGCCTRRCCAMIRSDTRACPAMRSSNLSGCAGTSR